MRATKELLRDPLAYTMYPGKIDQENTARALAERGKDRIVRLCFTPGEFGAPLRVLGSIAAAQHITRTYLPEAQLQLVAAIETSSTVNGIDETRARHTAYAIFQAVHKLPAFRNSRPQDVAYATDSAAFVRTIRDDRILPLVRRMPEAKVLQASADRRKGNYAQYVAGHFALHDIADSVKPLHVPYVPRTNPNLEARGIISIGGLSERPFYAARMACRDIPDFTTHDLADTGQLFTRHVVPPYNFSRRVQREPRTLTERGIALTLRDVAALEPFEIRADSLKRDLMHLRSFIEYYAPDSLSTEVPFEQAC